MSAFSPSLYSAGGNHQKRICSEQVLLYFDTRTESRKKEKTHLPKASLYDWGIKGIFKIIFKIWSLTKFSFPIVFLTNILWGRSSLPQQSYGDCHHMPPHAQPLITLSVVQLYSTCHTPLPIPQGLCNMLTPPRQAQSLPTAHTSPLPMSVGQPLGTTAKSCPPGHATTPWLMHGCAGSACISSHPAQTAPIT